MDELRLPVLDEHVIEVELLTSIMPDKVDLFVNGAFYAGAYRSAGEDSLTRVLEVYHSAQEALREHWTFREFHQHLARLNLLDS